jgi:hypothetical protein
MSKMSRRSGVAKPPIQQMAVAAHLQMNAADGCARQVRGHNTSGAAVEGER